MRQVYVGNAKQVNKWLKDNTDAKIIDIKFSNASICIIFEHSDLKRY